MNKIRFSLAHVKMDTEIAFIVQETCLTQVEWSVL